ncbi:MAG TPA: hypothetical protein VGF77_08455 [Allosphingosinicella sp.]
MADITGTFTAVGQSATISPETVDSPDASAPFNVSLAGTFVGTVQLERRFTAQGGATWHPLTFRGTQVGIWTAPCSETFEECQDGVEYRLNCTAFTSGVINYRLGQ